MKRKFIPITIALTIVLLGWTSALYSQGFSSILEKLDKIEAKLDQLEATQAQDVQELRSQIASIQPIENPEDIAGAIAAIQEQIDFLAVSIEEIIITPAQNPDNEIVLELAGDLRGLMDELRTVVEESSTPELVLTPEEPTVDIPGLTVSGFVDASNYYDVSSGVNTFGLDQVEVDAEKTIGDIGSVRADLEWTSDGAGGFSLGAEQGYVTFSPEFLGSWSLTFGKFNAPIGFELLDALDMYQYSRALVFDNGLPTNLSGAMLNAEFNHGWDQNVDINKSKTVGGRLGFTPNDYACGGLSVIYGAEDISEGDHLTVIDVDLCLTPVENWTFGGEYNYGNDEIAGVAYNLNGYLSMGHYDFNNWAGITARYDYFNDMDALRLGSGLAEKRQAVTIAPTFSIGAGMGALVEFRTDFSDQEMFEDENGEPAKSTSGWAFEMTYSF